MFLSAFKQWPRQLCGPKVPVILPEFKITSIVWLGKTPPWIRCWKDQPVCRPD